MRMFVAVLGLLLRMWCLNVKREQRFSNKDIKYNNSNRKTQEKAFEAKENLLSLQIPLHLHAPTAICEVLHQQLPGNLSIWHVVCMCGFVCVCAGEHPAQSHHYEPTLRHHDRVCHMTGREPEVDRTMLLVLAISFRDNKRQQKGFQTKYSSIALYPLNFRVLV